MVTQGEPLTLPHLLHEVESVKAARCGLGRKCQDLVLIPPKSLSSSKIGYLLN
jgi:hypothetical protein